MVNTGSMKGKWPAKMTKKGEGVIKEIVFDDDARREYLTGFRKRNLAKKEAKAALAKERQKQERLESRREKRKDLAQRAAENFAAVERAFNGSNLSDVDSDPEVGSSSAVAEPQELEFENEEQLATVTVVEDFEVDPLGEYRPARLGSASDSDSDGEATPMANPPKTSLATASSSKQKSASSPHKNKPSTKKRPAYQTKAERKLDKLKQKVRRGEKVEEGKLRRKVKSVGGGHGRGKGKKVKGGGKR